MKRVLSMSKVKSVKKYPIARAYAPGPAILKERPSLHASWIIPKCAWCHGLHIHGTGEGRREEHCPRGPVWLTEGYERPYGYTLKFAGVFDDPKLFATDARRKKGLYKAYLKGLEDRRKARLAAWRIEDAVLRNPVSKKPATVTAWQRE